MTSTATAVPAAFAALQEAGDIAAAAEPSSGSTLWLFIVVAFVITAAASMLLYLWLRSQNTRAAIEEEREFAAEERRSALMTHLDDITAGQNRLARRLDETANAVDGLKANIGDMIETRIGALTAAVANEVEAAGARLEERLAAAETANAGRVEDAAQTLARTLASETARAETERRAIAESVERLAAAQSAVGTIGEDARALRALLSAARTAGAMGEMQLRDLVRNALPPSAYAFDAKLSNGRRADCLIQLPAPPGPIVIDAGFPLETFKGIAEAVADDDLAAARRHFRKAALTHLVEVAENAMIPGRTADCAIMFVGSEPAFAELHGQHPDIIRDGFRARVWIVSPTTLMATIETMRAIMADGETRADAERVRAEAVHLIDDLSALSEKVAAFEDRYAETRHELEALRAARDEVARRAFAIDAKHGRRANGAAPHDATTRDLLEGLKDAAARDEISAAAPAPGDGVSGEV